MHGFKSRVARFYSTCRCPGCVSDNGTRTTQGLHHRLIPRKPRTKPGAKDKDAISVLLPVMLISGAILDSTYKTYKHLKLDIEIAQAQQKLKELDLDLEKNGLKDRVNLVAGYQRGLDAIHEAEEEAEWKRSKDGFSRLKHEIRLARGELSEDEISVQIPAGFEVGEWLPKTPQASFHPASPPRNPLLSTSFPSRQYARAQSRQYHAGTANIPDSAASGSALEEFMRSRVFRGSHEVELSQTTRKPYSRSGSVDPPALDIPHAKRTTRFRTANSESRNHVNSYVEEDKVLNAYEDEDSQTIPEPHNESRSITSEVSRVPQAAHTTRFRTANSEHGNHITSYVEEDKALDVYEDEEFQTIREFHSEPRSITSQISNLPRAERTTVFRAVENVRNNDLSPVVEESEALKLHERIGPQPMIEIDSKAVPTASSTLITLQAKSTTSSQTASYGKGTYVTSVVEENEARDLDKSWNQFIFWKSTELQARTHEAVVACAIYQLFLHIIEVSGGKEHCIDLGNDSTITLSKQSRPELEQTLKTAQNRMDELAKIPISQQQDLWIAPLRFPGYRADYIRNLEYEEFQEYQKQQQDLQERFVEILQDPQNGMVEKLSEVVRELVSQNAMPLVSVWNVLLVEFVRLGQYVPAGIILEMFQTNRWLYPTHITIEMGLRLSSLSQRREARIRFLQWVDRIHDLDTRPMQLKKTTEPTLDQEMQSLPQTAPVLTPAISSELVIGYLRQKLMDEAWDSFQDYRKHHRSLPISFLMHVQSEFVRKWAPWFQIKEIWSIIEPYVAANPHTTCSRVMALCMLQACALRQHHKTMFRRVKRLLQDPEIEALRYENFRLDEDRISSWRSINMVLSRLRAAPPLPGGMVEDTLGDILDSIPFQMPANDDRSSVYHTVLQTLSKHVLQVRNLAAGPALEVDSRFRRAKTSSRFLSALAQERKSFGLWLQQCNEREHDTTHELRFSSETLKQSRVATDEPLSKRSDTPALAEKKIAMIQRLPTTKVRPENLKEDTRILRLSQVRQW